MALTMARPYRHPKTGMYWLRMGVPAPLRAIVGKRELKRSLRTKDPQEARNAAPPVLAEFNGILASARGQGETPLTLRQIDGVMGAWYRAETQKWAEDPGEARHWDFAASYYGDMFRRQDGDEHYTFEVGVAFLKETADLLRANGIVTDRDSIGRTAERWAGMQFQFARAMVKRAEGDWSEDTNLSRFPTGPLNPPTPRAATPSEATGATLTGLVAGWWIEGQARNLSPSTHQSYSGTIANFAKFIGHEDATRVTPEDVIAFKDHRLAAINPRTGRPTSLRTVKDSDLAGLKAIFKWGLKNRRVLSNPAADVSVMAPKAIQTRDETGLSDAEANAILKAARRHTRGREGAKLALAKRWVPWLCAYTGARVGELAQLRKEDVFQDQGHWVLRITPEAGTVKNKKPRAVPLHPHLIAQGFPAFSQGCAEGHLFLTPSARTGVRGPWQTVKNRLQEFARVVVTDPRVQPNHGWRHRFKTMGRQLQIPSDVMNAILGHAAASVGDSYGDFGVDVKLREISKLPAYPEGV